MFNPVSRFIFQFLGATVVWLIKGSKGSINDEIAGPNEYSSKSFRNIAITAIVLIIVGFIFF